MKNRQAFVQGEWVFRITGPSKVRPGRIRVAAENVDKRDHPLAQAVAKIIEVWIASGRRRAA